MKTTGTSIVAQYEHIVVEWQETEEGEWDAWRVITRAPQQSYRLPDLDGVELTQVFATIAQFTKGDLPAVYLERRPSRISHSE